MLMGGIAWSLLCEVVELHGGGCDIVQICS